MNFKDFYFNTKERLTDSILSLWATGDAEMQKYFAYVLQEEELMANPVFQNSFPWAPSGKQFKDTIDVLSSDFIDRLDKIKDENFRFPKNRNPYKHQVESWDYLLNKKKSIAVTTGTGSGKTECFMIPVLEDIYQNSKNEIGINAIFLYPLNALIGSQKKRIDAWCKALEGIKYAVYNGNTPESVKNSDGIKAYPELISREQIRNTPPQILFTNPTMLEYILVRKKDVDLLNNSQGKLRWILLDEAHTLTGSYATEMSLLIRRVIDAFGVDIKNIRFAITSATVGQGSESEVSLKKFMAGLCGIEENSIHIIKGNRELPEITKEDFNKSDLITKQDLKVDQVDLYEAVKTVRKNIYNSESGALTLAEIGTKFKSSNLEQNLEIVDTLSETVIRENSVLPVRGHFFARGIGGVYVCTNNKCDKHDKKLPLNAIGTMTTIAGKTCTCCGHPLLELVECRSCGSQLLKGERYNVEYVRLTSTIQNNAFDIDDVDYGEIDDENHDDTLINDTGKPIFLAKYNAGGKYINDLISYSIDNDGQLIRGNNFVEAITECTCPHCGGKTDKPIHFRISSSFMNRVLADVVLEQTPEIEEKNDQILWQGRKFISFTDSRQGTAKISALINIDNETNWIRSQVFHKLCDKQKEITPNEASEDHLNKAIVQLTEELNNITLPIVRLNRQKELESYKEQLKAGNQLKLARLSWEELKIHLKDKSDLRTLFINTNPSNSLEIDKYLNALLFDQFARRLPRERSLENLGMVSFAYPSLDNVTLPNIAKLLDINKQEWQSLLKVSVDYIIRNYFHYYFDYINNTYCTSYQKSIPIYSSDSNLVNVKKWPIFKRTQLLPNRLSLLICAGLGYHELVDIDNETEDHINELLNEIWSVLKRKILTPDNEGFKIKLEEKSQFQLTNKLWLCPVKRRLIDVNFRGYSPWITGRLKSENIRNYKILKEIEIPIFPFPFNRDENNEINKVRTVSWIKENSKKLREDGVWNNMQESIILNNPLFLAGEHSAQQSEKRLKLLENKFEESKINILNCSTTMEMGVDIGGISAVLMSNVPPGPANYLQRAGRAGRRSESKSLALTFCPANPIGSNAIENPMWALSHKIAPPSISFNSPSVTERHINAFFLGKFIQSSAVNGINVNDKIQEFFFLEPQSMALLFEQWLISELETSLKTKLISLVKKTPFENKDFSNIVDIVNQNFYKLKSRTIDKYKAFEEALETLDSASPAYKAISFRKDQFLYKNAISYLAEEGFLPSAGMPTGIVEFDLVNIDTLSKAPEKSNPSYHITRALTEFAPGNNVVIDGKNYLSAGIMLKNNRGTQAQKTIIQSCRKCGYQRTIDASDNEGISSKCPHCKKDGLAGVRFIDGNSPKFTELIEPAGFAVDIFSTPSRKISETSNAQYVSPLLIGVKPWSSEFVTQFDIRDSDSNAEILYYNMGKGNGFSVCLHCGRTGFSRTDLDNHKRLRGGKTRNNDKECEGNENSFSIREHVILGGRFKTDFCEIRFSNDNIGYVSDESTLYSLGVILTKSLANFLSIQESEIGFGIKNYDQYSTVFMFDTARGGAGYSSQFSLYADEVFKISYNTLIQCDCKNACTKCLIDRSSQWYINHLDKNPAIKWLEKVINQTVPEKYKEQFPEIRPVIGNVKEDVLRLSFISPIKQVWLSVSNVVAEWNITENQFVKNLSKEIKPDIILNNQPIFNDDQDKITLLQTSNSFNIFIREGFESVLKTVCLVELEDGKFYQYLAEDFNDKLNENWGLSNGTTFRTNAAFKEVKFKPYHFEFNKSNVFEDIFEPIIYINSNKMADLLVERFKRKNLDLIKLFSNQKLSITYSDSYLKNGFGCLLLLQFIDRLSIICKFEMADFIFNGTEFDSGKKPSLLFHDFMDSNDRDNELISLANCLGIPIKVNSDKKIPHYRFFKFSNEDNSISVTIRPDGGIEHGWFLNQRIERAEAIYGTEELAIKSNKPILYTISNNSKK